MPKDRPLVFCVLDDYAACARVNYPRHAALIAADLGDRACIRYEPSDGPEAILWAKDDKLPVANHRASAVDQLAQHIVDGVYRAHGPPSSGSVKGGDGVWEPVKGTD